MIKRLIALTALLVFSGCSGPPASGEHWRQVGSIENGYIRFVEIDTASAHNGKVYQEAATALSADPHTWQIGFFLPGDTIPPDGDRASFFQAGGWANYKPAANYSGGKFGSWDCEKAGVEDAPLDALCGAGAKDQYDAVLDLATRDAWVTACGLKPFNGKALVDRFIATRPSGRREQLADAYAQMYKESLSGPDDHSDCENLRDKIIARGNEGRSILTKAMKG